MNNSYKYYKLAKMNLIEKYSSKITRLRRINKDMDVFININDFLANEQSLGPNADPGNILYEYTRIENINNYIKILIDELNYNKVVCITNYTIKYGLNYIVENAIVYNVNRDEILIPDDLVKNLKKCKNKRFIYIYFGIVWEQQPGGHANMILIDTNNKTIERYEPHGHSLGFDKKKIILNGIDKKFNKKLLSYLGLKEYTYISPVDISPKIGVQLKADAYNGMCVTYSMIYLQLRLMNPDVDQTEIIKYLLKKPKNEIYDIILRYAKYIEDKLKQFSNKIVNDNYQLYNITPQKTKKFITVNKRNEIDVIAY
jgi:hypothetical protein